MKNKEYFEKRLSRILASSGYSFEDACRLPIEKLIAIKGITIPNVRVILHYRKNLRSVNLYGEKQYK